MPGIFISYRRSDSPDATGRIYDRLVAELAARRCSRTSIRFRWGGTSART